MSGEMDIFVRSARLTDAGSIAAILRELGWFDHINNERLEDTEARIAGHLELCYADDSHVVLVAENASGEVAGYVSVHWLPYLTLSAPEGFVSELFVRESERSKGVGRMLLSEVEALAVKRGCSRLMLNNGRNRESYQKGFYVKQGWKEREQMANFILPL